MEKSNTYLAIAGIVVAIGLLAYGFMNRSGDDVDDTKMAMESLGGLVAIDGSSTVFPITEAVAEEFQGLYDTKVTVGVSGTGGGFKKFCVGETDISDASRPIKESEVELCAKNNIEYIEVPVAYDGIAVVVNPENTWVDSLTVADLQKMWEPAAQGTVLLWSDVRPEWPAEPLALFGPGADSGTFDYFTDAIVGEEGASRGDFTASEDDNVLVQGVASDPNALGFFGVAYYEQNKSRLKAVPIDDGDAANGAGAILPTYEAVADGTYQPLARPIFIYLSTSAIERPEVAAFVEYYLEEGSDLVKEVGYIAFSDAEYDLAMEKYENAVTGSVFHGGGSQQGVTVEDILLAQ